MYLSAVSIKYLPWIASYPNFSFYPWQGWCVFRADLSSASQRRPFFHTGVLCQGFLGYLGTQSCCEQAAQRTSCLLVRSSTSAFNSSTSSGEQPVRNQAFVSKTTNKNVSCPKQYGFGQKLLQIWHINLTRQVLNYQWCRKPFTGSCE